VFYITSQNERKSCAFSKLINEENKGDDKEVIKNLRVNLIKEI